MTNPFNGIVLINKEEGVTSHAVVKKIRDILHVRKAGHAGTLDPFATGLMMIILLGQGTKLSPYLMTRDKQYRVTVRLGITTDTFDPTGRVIDRASVPPMDIAQIKACALEFIGEIEQAPPVYSALKYRGKRAYEYARRGIPIELAKRKVFIHQLEVLSMDLPDFEMQVTCSSGTYIRSLAVDLGQRLGPGAHVQKLHRLSIGPFSVDNAYSLRDEKPGEIGKVLQDGLITLNQALMHLPEIRIDAVLSAKIRKGYRPTRAELALNDHADRLGNSEWKLVHRDDLVAVVGMENSKSTETTQIKVLRVFE